ncbi:MAG: thioredoxin domain-containing protein [Chloroflexi bacterium]|nr:thioredoxin domain-containing protein [Chloroflexota bacterium]
MPNRFRPALLAALLIALLAGCAAQSSPTPTATPAPTLDVTALAQAIAADIFATLTAQPTDTLQPSATATPSPTVTASYTPSPDAVATTLAQLDVRISEQQTQFEDRTANLPGTLIAQLPTGAPTLDVTRLAANIESNILAQQNTPAPTLDVPVLVSTVQVAVIETLIAQVTQQVAQQATQQAARQLAVQATQTAVAAQPADVSEDDDPALGPVAAQVVIIEFSDFSCPHCRDFALETLPRLLADYGDRVRFVFRDAPILGPTSGWAALAAECADDQGQFWAYHDLLFANQGSLDRAALTAFAEQLGLNVDTFDACVDNQTHVDELRTDLAAAQNAGVSGTPTFFINGQRVEGAQPYEVFAAIIDEELERLGLPTGPAENAATGEATAAVTADVPPTPSPTATPRS